ncbi:MAG: sensor histidine kinase [Phycisphaerales bacterium JB059]
MTSEQSTQPSQPASSRSRGLFRREIGLIALSCLGVAGLSALWAIYASSNAVGGRAPSADALVATTASACESLLLSDELSQARRHVVNVGALEMVESCVIRLPDGRVVAHSSPMSVALNPLEESWEGAAPAASESAADGQTRVVTPLRIAGRGDLILEMVFRPGGVAAAEPALILGEVVIFGVGAIACVVLVGRLRAGARGISAVRASLLDFGAGQRSREALLVDERFGPEARAWASMLEELEALRTQRADEGLDHALESAGFSGGAMGEALDALWQGVLILDEQGKILYSNGAAGVLLQARRDAMLGAPVTSMIQDETAVETITSVLQEKSSGRRVVEVDRVTGEGEVGGVLRISLRSLRGGDGAEALVIVEDVTQQRVADQARNAFVANATHELRTPLTNIRLYVEEAVDAEGDDAIRAKALNVINSEARRLERIVADMLSVSEIEAGSMAIRESDIRTDALLEELERDYEASSKEKGIELRFDLPPKLPVLRGDRDKIAMALHNLVGNAIKYTPAGGEVTVKVEDADGVFRVEVRDNGIGISEEDCQRVFEKFYRAKDKRIKHVTGSGIGLALAREVVRLHGGDIEVESEIDEGSRFTLSLPAPAEAA